MPKHIAENEQLKHNLAAIPRALVFLVALVAAFAFLNMLMQPIWFDQLWGSADKHAFYKEPKNTISCVFVGASTLATGLSPLTIYEQQGICCYNLASEQQPTMASYYWVKEAYRLHPESLKAVVLDASMLRHTPDKAFYHKALDCMEPSNVKLEALGELSKNPDDVIAHLFPAFGYHERWSSFEDSDFNKLSPEYNDSSRGFIADYRRFVDNQNADEIPDIVARESIQSIPSFGEMPDYSILNDEALTYLDKLDEFCDQHDLKLIIIRIPDTLRWTTAEHLAVQSISNQKGIVFLDFTSESLFNQLSYSVLLDTLDSGHPNYFGAIKISTALGTYLTANIGLPNCRNDSHYSFMEEQLDEWHTQTACMNKMWEESDVTAYLQASATKDNTVLILVCDDAANALSDEQRQVFQSLGLTVLSNIGFRNSYLGVIVRGTAAYEGIGYDKDGVNDQPIKHEILLEGNDICKIESGGNYSGSNASCLIGNLEYAKNRRGINVVVYNHTWHKVIASTCFDTCLSSYREPFTTAVEKLRAKRL